MTGVCIPGQDGHPPIVQSDLGPPPTHTHKQAEQRRRLKEEGAAGEGEVATVSAAQSQSTGDEGEKEEAMEEEEDEEGAREHSMAVLWELEWLPFMLRQALARSSGAAWGGK